MEESIVTPPVSEVEAGETGNKMTDVQSEEVSLTSLSLGSDSKEVDVESNELSSSDSVSKELSSSDSASKELSSSDTVSKELSSSDTASKEQSPGAAAPAAEARSTGVEVKVKTVPWEDLGVEGHKVEALLSGALTEAPNQPDTPVDPKETKEQEAQTLTTGEILFVENSP